MGRWLLGSPETGKVGFLSSVVVGIGAVGLLVVWRAITARRRPVLADDGSPRGGLRRVVLRLFGDLLLVLGAIFLVLAGISYLTEMYGPGRVLPRPLALAGDEGIVLEPLLTAAETPTLTPTAGLTFTPNPTRTPMPTATSTATPVPTVTPTAVPPGEPVRLTIPSIGVDSEVQPAGTYWDNGQLLYQTLPWVVAHYKDTAMAGAKGNGVYSGHVTSRAAGNVFADLYKMELGDEVHLYSNNHEFVYVVTGIREVVPTDTSVVATTPDATATLITCAGTWIPEKREYDRRLIITARLKR